ncbi:MAG: hypothetical protein KC505_08160 [Myxococcales bacterium]|nr:hypothetical protein [Myxococcales bacterium]USN50731.1 MAG: hypothetical protein H6731_10820 [Myxococcales bacterium]
MFRLKCFLLFFITSKLCFALSPGKIPKEVEKVVKNTVKLVDNSSVIDVEKYIVLSPRSERLYSVRKYEGGRDLIKYFIATNERLNCSFRWSDGKVNICKILPRESYFMEQDNSPSSLKQFKSMLFGNDEMNQTESTKGELKAWIVSDIGETTTYVWFEKIPEQYLQITPDYCERIFE